MPFHLFYMGTFSQWHPSKFEIDGIEFTHAEQYMMWAKAKLFGDEETAVAILAAKHPREQKKLGREVTSYSESKWVMEREKIVYKGNYAKFTQNPEMLSELLSTTGVLVEASPYDTIWGIGLGMLNSDAMNPSKWRGINLLGKILTQLRDDLKENKV